MEELDIRREGEMNKLRELIDYLAGLQQHKVIRNSRLMITGGNVEIDIDPKAGRDPVLIRCKTEDALRQVEEAIKEPA